MSAARPVRHVIFVVVSRPAVLSVNARAAKAGRVNDGDFDAVRSDGAEAEEGRPQLLAYVVNSHRKNGADAVSTPGAGARLKTALRHAKIGDATAR